MSGKIFQIKPKPFPVTAEFFAFASSEIVRLEKYRAEVLERLQHAREQGDLSENGAYTTAKAEQRDTDRELRRYRYVTLFAKVSEPTSTDVVGFGTYVRLQQGEKEFEYRIVSKHEADPMKKKISMESPLGTLLMGKRAGDVVSLETQAGKTEYQVKGISVTAM